ncbi:uncharacterized protein LOC141663933 isoform X2 [Apium graveolens]|uniref:uncharacterized protein LOC141663933 isoform X2 n=1 Tax=Apium graveolens TaxID=4045 RepID=UPI003D79C56F
MDNGEERAGHLFTSENLISGYNRQKKSIPKKKYHKNIKKGSPLSDVTNIDLQPLEKGKMKVNVSGFTDPHYDFRTPLSNISNIVQSVNPNSIDGDRTNRGTILSTITTDTLNRFQQPSLVKKRNVRSIIPNLVVLCLAQRTALYYVMILKKRSKYVI